MRVKDIGLKFNKKIGKSCLRVVISIKLNTNIDNITKIIKQNLLRLLNNKKSFLRLQIKYDILSYDNRESEIVLNDILIKSNVDNIKKYYKIDKNNILLPLTYIYILNKQDNDSTWVGCLFRHDIMDGFTFMLNVLPIFFEKSFFYYDKILLNKNKEKLIKYNLINEINNIFKISKKLIKNKKKNNNIFNEKYYFHMETKLDIIKLNAIKYKTKLTNFINAVFALAYFKALPTKKYISIGNTVFFKEKKYGNNICLFPYTISRSENIINIITQINKINILILTKINYKISKSIVKNYGYIPKKILNNLENKNNSFDLLNAIIPGADIGSYPIVTDFNVIRESQDWIPNIFYCISNCNKLYFDLYFTINSYFDKKIFENTLIKFLRINKISHKLPFLYN